ncbi:Rieske (2Fe-2S) protein [Arthrobacter sp.]|uniref:Rieske (2Fe-2S) protein n=1 Tax=Arthrobacter sp. TaxID=1667 RepID=UPI0028125607|nr:Rieske (2Fe-2S) protein [Arthrobacter sp.]
MSGELYGLGPIEQVPPGEGRSFGVNNQQIAVFRLRDGSLRAVSAVCPHRGGPIADGTIDQTEVLCPLHQHAFALDTGCSTTGAPPLQTYPVFVDADQNIMLQLE